MLTRTLNCMRSAGRQMWLVGPLVLLLAGTTPAFAACSPTPASGCGGTGGFCTDGNWFDGGYDRHYSSPWPNRVVANISLSNPSPVWSSSSVWVALENDSVFLGAIAPIGWDHRNQLSTVPLYFYQFTNASGSYYYPATYSGDASAGTYSVSQGYSCYRCKDGFNFEFANNQVISETVPGWGADTEDFNSETWDYGGSSGGQPTGSHTVGNTDNPVQFTNMFYLDQYATKHNPGSLNLMGQCGGGCDASQSTWYQNLTGGSTGLSVWDQRCATTLPASPSPLRRHWRSLR